MLPGLTTVSLPQIYCRSCHLSTRSDVVRCLHCNRPLKPVSAPVAARPQAPKRTAARKTKSRPQSLKVISRAKVVRSAKRHS